MMKSRAEIKKTQKATASDVAELVGMSKWTVLRAFKPGASISPTARNEVLAAAKKLGFRPNLLASSLKKRTTNIIGVVADEFSNPHTLHMLDEVTKQLNARGYMALVLNVDTGADYHSVLQMAGQLQVDALIYMATILNDKLIVTAEELHHIPSIHVCRNTDSADVEVVNVDGFEAGAQLGKLLTGQGYQRYGYMKGPDTSSSHLMRMEGYVSSLETTGKTLDTVLVAGHYDREYAWKAMTDYLRATTASNRIDALFCENDVLAFGAIQAMRDFDRSMHMGVVGFDDINEARSTTWNLTTWNQRADLQIAEAINRLIDHHSNDSGEWRKGELRIRASHLKA